MSGADGRQARLAAVVNGGLVFGLPGVFVLVSLIGAGSQPWPTEIAGFRPSTSHLLMEAVQFALVFAALGGLAAWRTRVHALRYLAEDSLGWQGVGEAAGCGLIVAVLYLAPGIVTRPLEAPPYVIFYGAVATVLGAMVGLILRTVATVVLSLSRSSAA